MPVRFVETTKNDIFLKRFKETEAIHKIRDAQRIKFVSKSGIKLKHLLERKDPFSSLCNDIECKPCVNTNGRSQRNSNCRKNNVCYEAKCRTCEVEGKIKLYHGEIARNMHVRSKVHYYALNSKSEKSFMYKHALKEHNGNTDRFVFDWKVLGKFQKPLSRQLAEAIEIDSKAKEVSLNSKSEYFQHSVKRLQLNDHENKEECTYCSRKFQKVEDLQTHETDFHTKHKCNTCEYIAIGLKDLSYHVKHKHSDPSEDM